MGFAQQLITAHDTLFRQRVELAVAKVAKDVQGELQASLTTTQWINRQGFEAEQ